MLFCKGIDFDQSSFKRFDQIIPNVYIINSKSLNSLQNQHTKMASKKSNSGNKAKML